MSRVPWRLLLSNAPGIVNAARKFYARARASAGAAGGPAERSRDAVESLHRAVERLESREVQHAALLTDLAKQVEDMATALQTLHARLRLALIGAGVALLVALATALYAWR